VLDYADVTRDSTTPMKHAVAALAARPRRGSEATPTAHPATAILAARCRVAAPAADAAVTQGRVRVAERRRVLVVHEISARWRPLSRVDRDQRQPTSFLPIVTYRTPHQQASVA